MLESLIIFNGCFAFLTKSKGRLKIKDLLEFLEPWYNIDKYVNEIF